MLKLATAICLLVYFAPALRAQQPACNCPGREYPATPTANVRRLFAAAERADTTAFFSALAAVSAPDSFALDETPLVATILWAQRWPAELRQDSYRTYQTVLRTSLDSLRAAHRASWPSRERMLAAALARKIDPNGFVVGGIPPLHLAATMGSPAMVAQLLAAGAHPNIEKEVFDNFNAIEFALDHEYQFRLLAFPEFITTAERTATVRQLLRAGTKPPWAGERFRMPAHSPWALMAALTDGDSVAYELIAAGLTATQTDVDGIPPIVAAAQFGNAAVVRVLRDVGPRSARVDGDSIVWERSVSADSNSTDLWLDAAIASATDTSARIAELLLQRGMRWSKPGPLGVVRNVPEHHRGVYGRTPDTGSDNNADVASASTPRLSTSSPLGRSNGDMPIAHAAAEADNVAMLRQLKALDAPLETSTRYQGTPLAVAVRANAYNAARWLLANGANPLLGDEEKSALSMALEATVRSDMGVADSIAAAAFVQELLRSVTREHFTTVGDASWLASRITRRIAPSIPALNALLERGWTPKQFPAYFLSTAIADRDTALVAWLLDHKAAVVPEKDSAGRPVSVIESPLMLAVSGSNAALLNRLLRAGATVQSAGLSDGLTPLGLALRIGNDTIIDLLRRSGDTLDSVSTPLLLGLALERDDAQLLAAVALRRDRPIRFVPIWASIARTLLLDSATLNRALRAGLKPDAFLLRYSVVYTDPDTSKGSLLELLVLAASEAVTNPADAPRVDAILQARIQRLAKENVLHTLVARSDQEASRNAASAPVITLSLGLRRSTLAQLAPPAVRLNTRSGTVLLSLAICRGDQEIAALARRRGARPLPAAEQRELCARVRNSER
jgi:ankyrin repeat protein